MNVPASGPGLPKYLVVRITVRGDRIVNEEHIAFYDKVHLEGEHPSYDCGIHDNFSFEPDSVAMEYYWYQFKKFNGLYWIDIEDPRTPDQLCEPCAVYVHEIKQHSMLKKKEKEVDYYEGDWSIHPALL